MGKRVSYSRKKFSLVTSVLPQEHPWKTLGQPRKYLYPDLNIHSVITLEVNPSIRLQPQLSCT